MRDLFRPGRSPAYGAHGIAATSHALATVTALDVLKSGGNAMDAAIAACAVQCVVEPGSTGLGGDCFAMYTPQGRGVPIAFNGSGRAPAALDIEEISDGTHGIDRASPHSVTVPGAVEAWGRLSADHGKLPFSNLLAPAIDFAENGYPVHQRTAFDWKMEEKCLARDNIASSVFLPQGKAPNEGEIHYQPTLARTLTQIANKGIQEFYEGSTAIDLVGRLQELGGKHTVDDFSEHFGEYVTPISCTYRDWQIFECPPNGQGVTALQILNILSKAPNSPSPLSPSRLHYFIESVKLAYADRDTVVGDPKFTDVPVDVLISDEHAHQVFERISPSGINPTPIRATHVREPSSTVYICVVDSERNVVSFINSLFDVFGSGIVGPESGVVLNNRGCGFSLDPSHPNALIGRKRPFHTLIPGMAIENEKVVAAFGVMGGQYQAAGHAYVLQNLLEFGLDVQEAIDLARVFPTDTGKVECEPGIHTDTQAELSKLGHVLSSPEKPIGGGQAILIDWPNGVLSAGSDPRKDGCALGF